MKILIAYDGSLCADEAMEGLSRAGLPQDVEALILSVAKVGILPPIEYRVLDSVVSEDWLKRTAALREAGRAACRRLALEFPAWRVHSETAAGSPLEIILEKALAWRPDLIVAGTHGWGVVVRAILGSISMKLIAEAPCPVRIGRTSVRNSGPIQIVIGADGSPQSDAVVEEVCRRSWPVGTQARLLAVFEVVPPTIGELMISRSEELQEIDDIQRGQLAAAVKRYSGMLASAGLSVSASVLDGKPCDVLLNEAEKLEADTIFVGARALSATERLLFGVSRYIVSHASCPVEVVHQRILNEDAQGKHDKTLQAV